MNNAQKNYLLAFGKLLIAKSAHTTLRRTDEETGVAEAENALKEAEDNLLQFALNMIPAQERKIIAEAVTKHDATRQKLLDLAIQLDAGTVTERGIENAKID